MKRKITMVLICLSILMLQLMLGQAPFYKPKSNAAVTQQSGVGNHWKICLAQNMCDARITGFLTYQGSPIGGTEFDLDCSSNYLIEPIGPFDTNFVFWKVWTSPGQFPTDIEFDKWIDADKDGYYEIGPIHISGLLTPPSEEEPDTWYQHVEIDVGPYGPWMVVVEVREQPYNEDNPYFEWQLTIRQENANVVCDGNLTLNGSIIPETEFSITCECTRMQCQVIRTPWCTVPNDIEFDLYIYSKEPPFNPIDYQHHHLQISQFPWIFAKLGWDPFTMRIWEIQLELTEVHQYQYYEMAGSAEGSASFAGTAEPLKTVPFHTRPQNLTPSTIWENITFTQRDPITGIVKLGVPANSFKGLDHTFYSAIQGGYIRLQLVLQEQGCGYLFTGIGKNPILADVDIITYNNNTGVYSFGPDRIPQTADDILVELGPCLRSVSGPDGVPGTGDVGDIFGDGVADPKGSSILYLPTQLNLSYYDGAQWRHMCLVPFPMLMTTSTASDIVLEPLSPINGVQAVEKGHTWRYLSDCLPWEDPDSNLKVTYACSWSKLNITTPMGTPSPVDIILPIREYKVRKDRYMKLRGDSNCDQIVDFKDLYFAARRYGTLDEGFMRPVANAHFNALADHNPDGKIDIKDIVWIAKNYKYIHGYHNVSSYQGTISVEPPSVSAYVGQTFDVNITVSGVTDLYLVVLGIRWDPAVLNLTGVVQGDFPNPPIIQVYVPINYTGGYLEGWTGTSMFWTPGSSGSGTVAKLQFEVIGTGDSVLDLYECSWMNSTEGQFGFSATEDGYFTMQRVQEFQVTWKWLNMSKIPPEVWFTANITFDCSDQIQNFNFNRPLGHLNFNIASTASGSCNVTIPKIFMSGAFKVLLNDIQVPCIITWNLTDTSIYFTYGPGNHDIKIKGEITTKIRGLWSLADANGDGIVDIFDIVIIAAYFGWEEDC